MQIVHVVHSLYRRGLSNDVDDLYTQCYVGYNEIVLKWDTKSDKESKQHFGRETAGPLVRQGQCRSVVLNLVLRKMIAMI